jgi:hypothetical protein
MRREQHAYCLVVKKKVSQVKIIKRFKTIATVDPCGRKI